MPIPFLGFGLFAAADDTGVCITVYIPSTAASRAVFLACAYHHIFHRVSFLVYVPF